MRTLLLGLTAIALCAGTATAKRLSLKSSDAKTVYANRGGEADTNRPIILLFHQARSNYGEYDSIAPKLHKLGFDTLAVDQRSGAHGWGRANQTVMTRGRSAKFADAIHDLEGALNWAKEQGYGKILLWGSSYSASLSILLAAKRQDELMAVLAFSPGEYLKPKGKVAEAADQVKIPLLVVVPAKEKERGEAIAKAAANAQLYVAEKGVHGSSILVEKKNADAAATWPAVIAFLKVHLPAPKPAEPPQK